MRVRELIAKLEKMPQEATVVLLKNKGNNRYKHVNLESVILRDPDLDFFGYTTVVLYED